VTMNETLDRLFVEAREATLAAADTATVGDRPPVPWPAAGDEDGMVDDLDRFDAWHTPRTESVTSAVKAAEEAWFEAAKTKSGAAEAEARLVGAKAASLLVTAEAPGPVTSAEQAINSLRTVSTLASGRPVVAKWYDRY
jgi:hypothetical protein